MSNPSIDNDQIMPPRTGEFELSQLLQYPNSRVRALASFLRERLHWTTRDSFTGEYVSHLLNYVERDTNGNYDFSRLQVGLSRDQNIAWSHYRAGTGVNPLRAIYVESREDFYRRNGQRGMRVDGSYRLDFEHIQVSGGRSCFDLEITTGRGLRHSAPGTCHSW